MKDKDISQWLSVHVGVSTINLAKSYKFLSDRKLLKTRPTRSGVINLCVQIIAGLYDENAQTEIPDKEIVREFLVSTPAQKEVISAEILPEMRGTIEAVLANLEE